MTAVHVRSRGRAWSLPLAVVDEVVRLPAWRPRVPPRTGVLGLLDVRGEEVPLVDLAVAHGDRGRDWDATDEGDVVLCTVDGQRVGVVVDEALGIDDGTHGVRAVEARLSLVTELFR